MEKKYRSRYARWIYFFIRDLQREVHNSRRLIQGMREQTAKAAAESEKSVRELRECREAVRKKKEQIAAIGKQRAADRRELEELRRYVYAGAEKAKEFTVDPIVSPHQRESGKDSEQSLKRFSLRGRSWWWEAMKTGREESGSSSLVIRQWNSF